MVKTLGIALLLMAATAVYAQQNTTVTPAQTQANPALRIVTEDTMSSRVDVEVGAIRLNTRSGRYTFAYLPLLAPLQGTAFRPSIEMPNAFALTGTTIPQKPWVRQQRHVLAGIR
jgi:hypothetical protein